MMSEVTLGESRKRRGYCNQICRAQHFCMQEWTAWILADLRSTLLLRPLAGLCLKNPYLDLKGGEHCSCTLYSTNGMANNRRKRTVAVPRIEYANPKSMRAPSR